MPVYDFNNIFLIFFFFKLIWLTRDVFIAYQMFLGSRASEKIEVILVLRKYSIRRYLYYTRSTEQEITVVNFYFILEKYYLQSMYSDVVV